MGILDRLQHGWNAFMNNKDPTMIYYNAGTSHYVRPDRVRFTGGNEKSIVTSVFNRMAMDAADMDIKHVRLDDKGRYVEDMPSKLNECLSTEANIDQTGKAFLQDVYMSMFDEGHVALVPIETIGDPIISNSYDIEQMRTGKVVEWRPKYVKVSVYNENKGKKDEIWLPKRIVGIVENPMYAVVNERNSTMQRLIRKLALLDAVDEQSSAGKLDLIIQLPYSLRSDLKRKQADQRREDIEKQLSGTKYGIAYTDATERITQLNRPLENNLLKQIEYLTSMLFSQLGISQAIMDGTADEKAMSNYYDRTIKPIVSAVTDEMRRKFLTKTARSQKQSIVFFRDPFGLVPVSDLAEMADKFTRNEIMTSNEIRQIMGMKPIDDPKADQLINSNISQPIDDQRGSYEDEEYYEEGE